jgi:hypothetical protein
MRCLLLIAQSALIKFSLILSPLATNCTAEESANKPSATWTENFNLQECNFSTTGKNEYFILQPGYQLVLEGLDGKDKVRLVITVLDKIELVGEVETRVVEERESVNGELIEVSHNFFAFCQNQGSIFYFGEDVDIYKDGKIVSHDGAWRAGSEEAKAGLMMPGMILLGARYYQEIAPKVAMDRAEILSTNETVRTPSGKFEKCLKTEETTPLEPDAGEFKIYAPGIGLVQDGGLLLTEFGFVKSEN